MLNWPTCGQVAFQEGEAKLMPNTNQTVLSATRQLLSVKDVARRFGASVRWVWRQVHSDPTFPKPVKASTKVTRWLADEVDAHITKLREIRDRSGGERAVNHVR